MYFNHYILCPSEAFEYRCLEKDTLYEAHQRSLTSVLGLKERFYKILVQSGVRKGAINCNFIATAPWWKSS